MNDIRNVGHEVQAEILKTARKGQEVQAEILKTARKGQEAVVGAIKTWTGTVRSRAPKELSLPFAQQLPFADRLPKAEELAGNAYEFAQKLLASQRKFAEGMLHAAAPMLPRSGEADKKTDTVSKANAGTGTVAAAKKADADTGPAAKKADAGTGTVAAAKKADADTGPAAKKADAGTGTVAAAKKADADTGPAAKKADAGTGTAAKKNGSTAK